MTPKRDRGNKSRAPIRVGDGRETELLRRPPTRNQSVSVLVVTNGRSTERQYLRELKKQDWIAVKKVVVVFKNGSPESTVVDAARISGQEDYDKAWAVCDVDNYDVESAISLAEKKCVHLALSQPCFEVWIILHFKECTKHFVNASEARDYLTKILPEYDKTKLDFEQLKDGIGNAVASARKLGQPPADNPSTDMWKLVEMLGKEC